MMRATPATPSNAPASFSGESASWRVTSRVMKNTKTGEVEFSTPASPLSTYCWPQASSRSGEHTSELQSLMRSSYAVFCMKKKTQKNKTNTHVNVTRHDTTQIGTHRT